MKRYSTLMRVLVTLYLIRQKETISGALSLQKASFKVKASGKRLSFNIF